MNEVRLQPHYLLLSFLVISFCSCGLQGEEATASIEVSMNPEGSIEAPISETFGAIAAVNSADLFAIVNPPTAFKARVFHSTNYHVDTQYGLVTEKMCYIAHVGGPNFYQFAHLRSGEAGYNDCNSDAPVTGYFFGPAPYGGSIDIAVPPRNNMHVEILGFEVEAGDDCSGPVTLGPVQKIGDRNGTDISTRPAIYYRGKRIDIPLIHPLDQNISNPNGGIYKFYSSDAVDLVSGDNSVALNPFPWNDAWESDTSIPPMYACGAEATLHFGSDLQNPVKSRRGSPVPITLAQAKPDFNELMAGLNSTGALTDLDMYDVSTDPLAVDGQVSIECPTGATQMSVGVYKVYAVDNSGNQAYSALLQCNESITRPDGSLAKGVKASISTLLPGSTGDYYVILATPLNGNSIMKAERRLWKFKKPI